MSLHAPFATYSESAQPYGEVAGGAPNWAKTNLHDGGRAHISSITKPELGSMGFQAWDAAEAPKERFGHRIVGQHEPIPQARSMVEPAVVGGHYSYYARRTMADDDPAAFRRSIRYMPQTERPDKPCGKRYVAEPKGPPGRPRGVQSAPNEVRYREADHAPEPGLPRLARPEGITGLRENWDKEIHFERALGRKVRVEQETYRALGYAGDTVVPLTGPPLRPEDDPTFFRTLKDSPTFLRFCSTLAPPPTVSAHERRSASIMRKQEAERSAEQQLVASLQLPGDDD